MNREDEVTSYHELERELCHLLETAVQGGVDLGSVSTYRCRPQGIGDREVMVSELADRSEEVE